LSETERADEHGKPLWQAESAPSRTRSPRLRALWAVWPVEVRILSGAFTNPLHRSGSLLSGNGRALARGAGGAPIGLQVFPKSRWPHPSLDRAHRYSDRCHACPIPKPQDGPKPNLNSLLTANAARSTASRVGVSGVSSRIRSEGNLERRVSGGRGCGSPGAFGGLGGTLSPALGVVMDAFHREGGEEALGDDIAGSGDRERVASGACGLAEGERPSVSWIWGASSGSFALGELAPRPAGERHLDRAATGQLFEQAGRISLITRRGRCACGSDLASWSGSLQCRWLWRSHLPLPARGVRSLRCTRWRARPTKSLRPQGASSSPACDKRHRDSEPTPS
jgi:hypothetical protein